MEGDLENLRLPSHHDSGTHFDTSSPRPSYVNDKGSQIGTGAQSLVPYLNAFEDRLSFPICQDKLGRSNGFERCTGTSLTSTLDTVGDQRRPTSPCQEREPLLLYEVLPLLDQTALDQVELGGMNHVSTLSLALDAAPNEATSNGEGLQQALCPSMRSPTAPQAKHTRSQDIAQASNQSAWDPAGDNTRTGTNYFTDIDGVDTLESFFDIE